MLWDSLKEDLEEKIHRLEEDKHNVDFGLWGDSGKLKILQIQLNLVTFVYMRFRAFRNRKI